MTAIVAIKRGDCIHIGADTQITAGQNKRNMLVPAERKIAVINGDTLLAFTGSVKRAQIIKAHPEWFDFDREKGLTKEFLVCETVPKIYEYFKEHELIDSKPGERLDVDFAILVAYKDKMFEICSELIVLEYQCYQTLGGGDAFMLHAIQHMDESADVDEQILEALRLSSRFCIGVSAPYILVNSKDLECKIVEE